ncbi:MAG: hypothetical protein HYT30_00590 [Parcubacteria group bacterium]|nr:hypothetical protein [Parcubacteria group bacterium]
MPQDIEKRLSAIDQKIDAIYVSAEKTRKYFLATLVMSAVLVLLPLLGVMVAGPTMMSGYADINVMDLERY